MQRSGSADLKHSYNITENSPKPISICVDVRRNEIITTSMFEGVFVYNVKGECLRFSPTLMHYIGPSVVNSSGDVFAPSNGINIVKLDSKLATSVTSFGEKGDKPGQFKCANILAVDNNDNIYVGDRDTDKVQVFRPDFSLLHIIDLPEEVVKRYRKHSITDIAIYNNKIYVCDSNRVRVYSLDGKYLFQFKVKAPITYLETAELCSSQKHREASGMTITNQGELIISDRFQNCIQVFDAYTGGFIARFGRSNGLRVPSNVAVLHDWGRFHLLFTNHTAYREPQKDYEDCIGVFSYWSKGKPNWINSPMKNCTFSDVDFRFRQ